MKTLLSLILLVLCGICRAGDVLAALAVNAETLKPGDVCLITCQVKKPTDVQIQVVNAQGKAVRTMLAYQAKIRADYPWNGKDDAGKPVPAGDYTLRVQAGLTPQLDTTFGANGALAEFTSPFDVALDKAGNIFLADRGDRILFKLSGANGKLMEDFAAQGKLLFPEGYPRLQTVKVDKAGYIYTTGNFHNIAKYDKKGNLVSHLGGWYLDDQGKHTPENTVGALDIALGDDKIYIQRGGADGIVVFNTAFPGKEGFLFKSSANPKVYSPQPPGLGYCGPGMDGAKGVLYGLSLWQSLIKMVDTGTDIEAKYNVIAGPDGTAMRHPTGVTLAPDGTLWVADWGNGRLIRFFDTGGALVPVFSFGEQAEGALEDGCFINPHGLAVSADGKYLYLAEDGEPAYNYEAKKPQAFTGAHRLSRWIINVFADTAEKKLTVAGG